MNAGEFVETAIGDQVNPVVIFALEWCEFCWAVRKFMASRGIDYHAVEVDSVPFQADMLGRRIRDELKSRTGCGTIPQIFIGGEFVGGCTDMLDGWLDGRIQALLEKNNVAFSGDVVSEPYSFLPEWLHPR